MHELETLGYLRTAVASPQLSVADTDFNVRSMIDCIEGALESDVRLLVFPELSITGYSCGDLFYQKSLLDAARAGLMRLAEVTSYESIAVVVGLPLEVDGRIYNCAALLCGGDICGIVPKTHLPNTREFYEQRWFTSGKAVQGRELLLGNRRVPFGTDILFECINVPACVVGLELCEDLWSVCPPSGDQALAGATVLINPSASDELLGKADYRRNLVLQQSARCHAAYVYAASGAGESTTDVVYSGHSLIAENGHLLAQSDRFSFENTWQIADVDCAALLAERTLNNVFGDAQARMNYRRVRLRIEDRDVHGDAQRLYRNISKHPFVPSEVAARESRCEEIFAIQSTGLAKRLRHTGLKTVTLGISGGLDSTLALLVTVRAFDRLKFDRKGIVAVTMPGFGTTDRTRDNATKLAQLLGVTLRTVSIADAVNQHFEDIGHDPSLYDITYENAQARERTQVLMDIANQSGGFVVGTGDLSEAALGWCTFNGDHMSMYHVNIGVPKTLVRYIVDWCADNPFRQEAADVLRDVGNTPVTPELLPVGEGGELLQETEKSIGPYELHDFFLFHCVRHTFEPAKVLFLAQQAFGEQYSRDTILQWLAVFYRRFFAQQFKRSAMPDGPKVGTVALSPRGDWRMPSDASAQVWLAQIERLRK